MVCYNHVHLPLPLLSFLSIFPFLFAFHVFLFPNFSGMSGLLLEGFLLLLLSSSSFSPPPPPIPPPPPLHDKPIVVWPV